MQTTKDNTDSNKASVQMAKNKGVAVPTAEIVIMKDGARIPDKADFLCVGYDLSVPEDTLIPAKSRFAIPMGIGIGLPAGYEGKIEARSGHSLRGMPGYVLKKEWMGLSHKEKMEEGLFDCDVLTGKIDPGYKGEVHVIVRNNSDRAFYVEQGMKIAQITFYRIYFPEIKEVEHLRGYNRGGGFGHSGI